MLNPQLEEHLRLCKDLAGKLDDMDELDRLDNSTSSYLKKDHDERSQERIGMQQSNLTSMHHLHPDDRVAEMTTESDSTTTTLGSILTIGILRAAYLITVFGVIVRSLIHVFPDLVFSWVHNPRRSSMLIGIFGVFALVVQTLLWFWLSFEKNEGSQVAKDVAQQKDASLPRVEQCRQDISQILGGIGAPLLERQDHMESMDISDPERHFNCLRRLCQSHVTLYKTTDISLESIKAGASIQLGASFSTVERVEHAYIGRIKRQQKNAVNAISMSALRQLTANALQKQLESLESIENTFWSHKDSNEKLENIVELSTAIPAVVTIHWLRSRQRNVGVRLSRVLGQLTSMTSSLSISFLRIIEASIQEAQEMKVHIDAALGFCDDDIKTLHQRRPMDPSNRSSIEKNFQHASDFHENIGKLRQTVYNLQIALLAIENSEVTATESNAVEDAESRGVDHWFDQVEKYMDIALSLKEKIQEALATPQTEFATDNEGVGSSDEQAHPRTEEHLQEHEFESVETKLRSDKTTSKETTKKKQKKITVFSGKGIKEPQSSSRRVPTMSTNNRTTAENSESIPNDPIATQRLVHELESRLQTLRPLLMLEEEGADKEDTDFQSIEEFVTVPIVPKKRRADKENANALFLGASGSLLGELKETLKAAPSTDTDLCVHSDEWVIEN